MAQELTVVTGSADADLVGKWNEKIRAAQTARQSFERQWHQNIAFYHGRQWLTIGRSPDGNGFVLSEAPNTDRFRVRFTANRIRRIIRQEVTKLSKEEPQFYTNPASTDESDRAAAQAADAVAEYLIYAKNFNIKRTEATFWAALCGTSFLKTYYDGNQMELDGQPGKIDWEAVTAFHLFVPYLQVQDIQRQPWVAHTRVLSPEDVFNMWGKEVPPQTDVAQTLLDARFMSSMGIGQSKNKAAKMCYVKEIWVKPNKEFPSGAMFVISEDRVLYVEEKMPEPMPGMPMGNPDQLQLDLGESAKTSELSTPIENAGPSNPVGDMRPPKSELPGLQNYEHEFGYPHGLFPFSKIDHVPTGMFYATSVIQDLIPIQKEYNRTRSIMLEHRNYTAKPQYFFTKGSINPKHLTSQPGLHVAVNLGFEPPKPLEQPPQSPALAQELEIAQRDMDDASAQFEISKGRTPPGVEAASAIAYLQEENDTILFHTVQSLESAVQDAGIQALALVHAYWDESRIVTITSRNQAFEVRKFKTASLKPMSDFRVVPGSMAPRSAAAKQAFITEIMKMGWITPEQGFPYLQLNETNAIFKQMMVDVNQAQRENMMMADNIPINVRTQSTPDPMDPMAPPVQTPIMVTMVNEAGMPDPTNMQVRTTNSFDNHEKHIEVHERYMKSQEWYMLPENIKTIFERHVEEHKNEIAKQMFYSNSLGMQQQPQAAPPPGGPDQQPIQEGEVVNA